MIDFSDPPWLVLIAFVVLLLGLMVWFPVYSWRKDRKRRSSSVGRQ
jgi:hypothetical protein